MNHPHAYRRVAACAAILALAIIAAPTAWATDNDTGQHWHTKIVRFRPNVNLPADWKGAIAEAGKAWTDRTKLDFIRGGDTAGTDPNTTGDQGHLVWRGSIPSSWQSTCPPATALACTRVLGNPHLTDADTVFNSAKSLGTSSTNCTFDIGRDVQTVALHEFGHWGRLSHSSDSGAAMYESYNDCQRTPSTHDVNSMNANYTGH